MNQSANNSDYQRDGYILSKGVYTSSQVDGVRAVLERFHSSWLRDNLQHYENGAINSAYITNSKYLQEQDRQVLFEFIGSRQMHELLQPVLPRQAMFVNSQLFFDPLHSDRKNYWHRDGQYNSLSLEEQKASLHKFTPLHVRIALKPERGVELVPGSHYRWDSEEELDVRMQRNARNVYDDLESGRAIELHAGDVLLFSANMIHRGLYGGDRLALDLLFANADKQFASFVDPDCLPRLEQIELLEWPDAFVATRHLLEA